MQPGLVGLRFREFFRLADHGPRIAEATDKSAHGIRAIREIRSFHLLVYF
jgi:hypothetical protein